MGKKTLIIRLITATTVKKPALMTVSDGMIQTTDLMRSKFMPPSTSVELQNSPLSTCVADAPFANYSVDRLVLCIAIMLHNASNTVCFRFI